MDPHSVARPRGPRAIRVAYLASAGSTALAGLMWSPEPVRSAMEVLLTFAVAPLGLLIAARRASRGPDQVRTRAITRSWPLLVTGFAAFAVFALVQGRGLGPLADVALHQRTGAECRSGIGVTLVVRR